MRVAGQASLRGQVEGVDGKALLGRDVGEGDGIAGFPDSPTDAKQQAESVIALKLDDGAGQLNLIVDFDLGVQGHKGLTTRCSHEAVMLFGGNVFHQIRAFE